ncbi:GntR family transcriptional regulator [Bosea sp. NBC_00550]|uniref:GntR family transcriptional regulator n=1 Tax=Bosea sp. NBC_00550 TaxID=2969621 RepID=UPI00222E1E20|nr:GntR family transcriptional regulator [Bosea sp. NBC_00550]UZF95416.1 GntR family transcriptional regulator [Bosea sp. NBC_00550]
MAVAKAKDAVVSDPRTITNRLEEDIALGRIMPRERLIEEELALRFGVNRHVIRQVLMELETIGLIIRQKNKGATVRDLLPEDVINIYAVRELLEGKAAELIPLPAQPDVVKHLKDIQERHSKAADAGDLANVFRLNLLFHKTFFAACGNPHLADAIQHFALKAHIARSLTVGDPKLLRRAIEEHAKIVHYLETSDRENLVRLAVDHIIPSREAYLETYRRRFGDFKTA